MIGEAKIRVDGPLKVTGRAKYTLEFPIDNPLYAVIAKSTIAKGRITNVDTASVEQLPGVVKVIHAGNALKLKPYPTEPGEGFALAPGEPFIPLQDNNVYHIGQHIAIVLAETLEDARLGASRLQVTYQEEEAALDKEHVFKEYFEPERYNTGEELQHQRGNFEQAKNNAAVVVEEEYMVPAENHNPMEPAGTMAMWQGERLTVYDSTQGVDNARNCVAHCFGLDPENVRLLAYYIGGGFGCKGFFWPHTLLAPMAAKIMDRPVKLVLSRKDMYTSMGHRPEVIQRVTLASDNQGNIAAAEHVTYSYTSINGAHYEPCGLTSAKLYNIANFSLIHRYTNLNYPTPTPMRGPGEANGTFALESAMDELAEKLNMDPVALRIQNYAGVNPVDGLPYSSNKVKECYRRGAALFGWEKRNRQPGKMLKNGRLTGHGMATATYPAYRAGGACRLVLKADGTLTVQTAIQDIGTGTYTVMGQIAADALGMPSDRVTVEIGDSDLPPGPLSGGSMVTASAGSYIQTAAQKLKAQLIQLATEQEKSPFFNARPATLTIKNGMLQNGTGSGEPIQNILERDGRQEMVVEDSTSVMKGFSFGQEAEYSYQSFGAVFAEASVDVDLGVITIPRIVGVYDVGKIINPKLANSQFYGGIIFGYSMALLEATEFNERGQIVNHDLAEYHVPVNADINDISIEVLDEPDYNFSEHGGRGIGEISAVGVAGAIANAIYNATGKRIRELPITLDKLM